MHQIIVITDRFIPSGVLYTYTYTVGLLVSEQRTDIIIGTVSSNY